MKKILFLIAGLAFFTFAVSAQNNATVAINDDIYGFLEVAQKKGLCYPMNSYKPYTKAQILKALYEIDENWELLSEREAEILEAWLEKYDPEEVEKKMNLWEVNISNDNEDFPASFNYKTEFEFIYSGGLYNNSDYDNWAMDNIYKINFFGDLGKNLSYHLKGILDLSYVPMQKIKVDGKDADYFIGYPWYDDDIKEFTWGEYKDKEKTQDWSQEAAAKKREIKRYRLNSYLPYSYKKPWSGQFYFAKNMSAEGLEGWANSPGIGFSIDGEIRASVLNDHVIIGMGRIDREIAGMDEGSSLVLNDTAYPFLAVDTQITIFKWLKFYSLTGVLEYPNQDYINEKELKKLGMPLNLDDAYFYQNAFSLNMIELDFKRLHLDFGSSSVWPKRFELGYAFPLANYVEYQNHIGDCDNLGLFGDFKYTIPGAGSIWLSFFLDEINGLNNNPFNSSRDMFAYQAGIKAVIPGLPFASLSFRYTKLEPYCYTHQSINYTPWYDHYICETYSNNGESLGYYLPPNSDEFHLAFKFQPAAGAKAGVTYQLIRHGADYGTQQVPGSNIYSELCDVERDKIKKYFLHDGAYNWIHILSTNAKFSLNTKIPVSFYSNLGFMFSYFTVIDDEKYDRSEYGNNGNCHDADFSTPFDIANTDQYPNIFGAVLTVGASINF